MSNYYRIPGVSKSLTIMGTRDAIRKLSLNRKSYTSVVIGFSGHVDLNHNTFLQARTAEFYIHHLRLANDYLRVLPKRWTIMVYIDDKLTLFVYNVEKEIALSWCRKNTFGHKLTSEYQRTDNGNGYYKEDIAAEYGEAEIKFHLPSKEVK